MQHCSAVCSSPHAVFSLLTALASSPTGPASPPTTPSAVLMDAEGSSQSQLKIPDAAARESNNSSAPSNQIDVGEYEYNEGGLKKAKLQSMLRVLLDDPLLSDVPKNPTLADVDTLLSLELGSAMRLSVLKLDGTSFEVTVMNSATVKDLKLAIKKKVNDMEQSGLGHRHISWKHVWENYCLAYHNNKLLHDDDPLQNFGIRNNSQVHFVSFVMTKESHRHSKRRKHRFFHGLNKLSHEKNCED